MAPFLGRANERSGARTAHMSFDALLKRAFDLLLASTLLVLALPLLALVSLAIKLDSPGPLFFRGIRVGYGGREFAMLKFRKMRRDAEGPGVTIAGDARLTRVGRLLVGLRIDELPQLWHVLTGAMSLIGPRPEDPKFVELCLGDYAEILKVRPGITGLSQLAFVDEASILEPTRPIADYVTRVMPQKIALDRLYAHRRNFGMDLRILFWTAVVIASRRRVAVDRRTGRLGIRRRPAAPAIASGPALVRIPLDQ